MYEEYKELVRLLRDKAAGFDYDGWVDTAVVMEKAANVIEELSKRAPPVPHGRLIDADKLGIRDAEKQAYEAYLREKGEDFIEEPIIEYHRGYLEGLTHASGLVRFAPTIIPASKEES